MSQPDFTIIIPHYNIPDLLMRCLRSIPVREDIQVIVVDDCSPGAASYLEKYPDLSRPYLEFYSTPRGGSAGRARNIGVEHARGRWLSFVDADDLLPDDISETFAQMRDCEEELIIMDYRQAMTHDLSVESNRAPWYHDFLMQYLKDGDPSKLRYLFDPMWGKLVKRELVEREHLRFDETRWGNDCYFSISAGVLAQSVRVYPHVGYILTQREGSLADNYCGTIDEMTVRTNIALRVKRLLIDHQVSLRYSPVGRIDGVMRQHYGYLQRISIAFRLWRHPRFALHLLLSPRPLKVVK